MKTINHFRIGFMAALLILSVSFLNGQPRPGIECGCTEYGYYRSASTRNFSVYVEKDPNEGFSSKKKKYRLLVREATYPDEVILTIYFEGNQIFNENTSAYSWGFSPDEDRFVMHGMDQSGNHWCRLANLNPESGIEGEQAIVWELIRTPVKTSAICFSPNGKYLLYAGVDPAEYLVLNFFFFKQKTAYEIA